MVYLNTLSNSRQIHKMAAKTSWHRYGTKLRHCHAMCILRGFLDKPESTPKRHTCISIGSSVFATTFAFKGVRT